MEHSIAPETPALDATAAKHLHTTIVDCIRSMETGSQPAAVPGSSTLMEEELGALQACLARTSSMGLASPPGRSEEAVV